MDKIGKIIDQGETYHYLYEKYNQKCQWLNFFDPDEFLVLHPQNGKNITIKEYLNHERFNKCDEFHFFILLFLIYSLLFHFLFLFSSFLLIFLFYIILFYFYDFYALPHILHINLFIYKLIVL